MTDFYALAQGALALAAPYLAKAGDSAAVAAGKSAWEWAKSHLAADGGSKAIARFEANPQDNVAKMRLTADLAEFLETRPEAVAELKKLLAAGAQNSAQSAVVTGNNNVTLQTSGGSSVTINR